MSDETKTGVADDEKETNALLALLYPEEGNDVAKSELVSDDELIGMRGLRSLFRDMPEEEPSDAVTNKLLAMAAQHAPKPAAEPKGFVAWLSDWFMPLMAHPGLAAAATLVLVAGVAGTLYVKGDAQMAEPQVKSRSEAPASGIAPAAPGATAETSTADQTAAIATETDEAPSADPSAAAPEPANAADKPNEIALGGLVDERKREVGKSSKADFKDSVSGRKSKGATAPGKKRKSRDALLDGLDFDSAGESYGYGGGGTRAGIGSATGKVNAPAEPEPVTASSESRSTQSKMPVPSRPKPSPKTRSQRDSKPSPAPPPQQSADGNFADSEDDSREGLEEEHKQRAPTKTSAASLHSQAIAAAGRGDCKRVRSLGDQIRKLDSGYYDRTFLSDTRLKACRAADK